MPDTQSTANLLMQVFSIFGPLVLDAVERFRERHGRNPTKAELSIELQANIAASLSEGAEWKRTHPLPPVE